MPDVERTQPWRDGQHEVVLERCADVPATVAQARQEGLVVVHAEEVPPDTDVESGIVEDVDVNDAPCVELEPREAFARELAGEKLSIPQFLCSNASRRKYMRTKTGQVSFSPIFVFGASRLCL